MRSVIVTVSVFIAVALLGFIVGCAAGALQQSQLWGRWEGINHIETASDQYISHDILLFGLNKMNISSQIYSLDEQLVLSHTIEMQLDWMDALTEKNIFIIRSNEIKTYDNDRGRELIQLYQAFSVIQPLLIVNCNELLFSARFGLTRGYHLLFRREHQKTCKGQKAPGKSQGGMQQG